MAGRVDENLPQDHGRKLRPLSALGSFFNGKAALHMRFDVSLDRGDLLGECASVALEVTCLEGCRRLARKVTKDKLSLWKPSLRIVPEEEQSCCRRHQLIIDSGYTAVVEQKPIDACGFIRPNEPAIGTRLVNVSLDQRQVDVMQGCSSNRKFFKECGCHRRRCSDPMSAETPACVVPFVSGLIAGAIVAVLFGVVTVSTIVLRVRHIAATGQG